MPDLKVTVERTVAAGSGRGATGRRLARTRGRRRYAGNGARIGIEGMTFFRFSSGRIVEAWTVVDIATLRSSLS